MDEQVLYLTLQQNDPDIVECAELIIWGCPIIHLWKPIMIIKEISIDNCKEVNTFLRLPFRNYKEGLQ